MRLRDTLARKRRRLWLLVWKEFLQLRRDPMFLRMALAMPIAQLVLLGYVVGADVTNLPTAIVDLDRTPVSRSLDAAFTASGYFTVVAHPEGEENLQPLIDRSQVAVAIVIPSGTQAALERGETAGIGVVVDGADSQTASVGTSHAARIITRLNDAASGGPGVDARVRVVHNQELRMINTMLPGLMVYIMILSMLAIMSQAVVKERERGMLEQLFVTPITRGEYLLGKMIPYTAVAIVQALLVAAGGALWFGVPMVGSVLVVAVGLGLFLLTNVGLGMLVSLVSRTRQQAQQTMMFILLPTVILSGFMFPVESMPAVLQPWIDLIPMTHALRVVRGVMVKGAGFADLAAPLWTLAAFAVAVFGAAVVLMQRRLSE